ITPKAAARAAIEIIQSTRQNTTYVGGVAHPGLSVSFNQLERTARAVAEDDGTSPAATENRISAFYKALEDTEAFASSLATEALKGPTHEPRLGNWRNNFVPSSDPDGIDRQGLQSLTLRTRAPAD